MSRAILKRKEEQLTEVRGDYVTAEVLETDKVNAAAQSVVFWLVGTDPDAWLTEIEESCTQVEWDRAVNIGDYVRTHKKAY